MSVVHVLVLVLRYFGWVLFLLRGVFDATSLQFRVSLLLVFRDLRWDLTHTPSTPLYDIGGCSSEVVCGGGGAVYHEDLPWLMV